MKSIKTFAILSLLTVTCFGADRASVDALARHESNLKQSIERLTQSREQLRQEVISTKQEIAALKEEITRLRQQETNQVIIVKIILPSTSRQVLVEAEK